MTTCPLGDCLMLGERHGRPSNADARECASVASITDYITGRTLNETPEEKVRQELAHILVDGLGYPKEHMTIEFPIQRGSNKRAERADIAIFRSAKHEQTNLLAIVETKAPGMALDDQAFSYATATTAELVLWFDGLERGRSKGAKYYWRDMASDPTKFVEVPNFPAFGESMDSVGKYRKADLRPVHNLKGIFRRLHNRLYGEGPLKREDAIAQEVIKILFCKLWDELYSASATCEFSATVKEMQTAKGKKAVADRVRGLFKTLKADPAYGAMFKGERLVYPDEWIAYIVSELQAFGLTHEATNTDAIGDAYEVFIGPQLKGESGQFFTPRSVVRLAIEIMKPSLADRESLIDPACGSGGFLSYALRDIRQQAKEVYPDKSDSWRKERVAEYASSLIHGIDADPLLHRVAKSYMAIVGNGRSGIFQADSLAVPDSWANDAKARIGLESFDVIITNPPFGTKIKVENASVLKQYQLAYNETDGGEPDQLAGGGQDPAVLFIERCQQLLKPGGRMAVVLPRQILSGQHSSVRRIRRWILEHFKLLAVVDLPSEAFQPYTGTITSVLFAERSDHPPGDYEVFMAVAESVGHDRRGDPLIERTPNGQPVLDDQGAPAVIDDTGWIAAEYETWRRLGRVDHDPDAECDSPSAYTVPIGEIHDQRTNRLDAWYYDPTKNQVVKDLWDLAADESGIGVSALADLVAEPSHVFYPGRHKRNYCPAGPHAVPFLSGTNILQARPFGVKWQPREYKPVQAALVQEGWILVTRSGSVGRVVYVGPSIGGYPISEGVAVSEHVIRVIADPKMVDPGYLYAFLASETGSVLIDQGTYASVVQHITPQHIMSLPVPVPSAVRQKEIGDRVRAQAAATAAAATETLSILKEMDSLVNRS